MKFGTGVAVAPDFSASDPYAGIQRRLNLLEELGFEYVTVAHHRFTPGYASQPLMQIATMISRSSTIKFAQGIYIVTLQHPLDVAEQIATLDQLSNGRIILGAGVGYRDYEFDAVQIPFETRYTRMTETLQICRKAWSEEKVSWDGKVFQFKDVELVPKPVQPGGPPIWIGGSQPSAVRRAARYADGYLGGLMESLDALEPMISEYRAASVQTGRPPTVVLMRMGAIASTRKEIEETWLPGALAMYAGYWKSTGGHWADPARIGDRLNAGEKIGFEEFTQGRAVVGDPEDCVREIQRAVDATGCAYMQIGVGGQSIEDQEDRLRLFAKEVMPVFAD